MDQEASELIGTQDQATVEIASQQQPSQQQRWPIGRLTRAIPSRILPTVALLGRFVRRYPEVPAAAVAVQLTVPAGVAVQASGLLPAGPHPAVPLMLGAIIAGAVATSPHLQRAVASLLRLAREALISFLATIGAAATGAALFWDKLGAPSSWTVADLIAHARNDGRTGLLALAWTWAIAFALLSAAHWSLRPGRGPAPFSRRVCACHEAAHALVAVTLGLPLQRAQVLRRPDRRGVGGCVEMSPPDASPFDGLYGTIVRKIAVDVAGCVGESGPRSLNEIHRALERQADWSQAVSASWLAAAVRPDRVLWEDVLAAVMADLAAGAWQLAIKASAKELLRARGEWVPHASFAATATRFGLTMPTVEGLLAEGRGFLETRESERKQSACPAELPPPTSAGWTVTVCS